MEREVLPGVYITDFRSQSSASAQPHTTQSGNSEPQDEKFINTQPIEEKHFEPRNAGQITQDMNEISNALKHLKSSNEQLREALLECPNDKDFEDAIKENEVVIVKKEAHLKRLQEELRLALGASAHLDVVSSTIPSSDTPAAMEDEDDGGADEDNTEEKGTLYL